jgi:AraC family transcriptional regulator
LTGIQVENFSAVPDAMGRMRIPEQYYAVFLHTGHISSIQKTWELILNNWLPRPDVHAIDMPNFELYDERFNPETGMGSVEIFIPVKK